MWDDLPEDVRAELLDPDYSSRQHYSRATYALGCHGPLCQLAETHRGRRRNEIRAKAKGKEYKPALSQRDIERDKQLAPIVAWHLHEREGAALAARA